MISQSVIIGTTHDDATVSLGREWSLPTQVQFDELIHYCKWEWRTNGVMIIGVMVTQCSFLLQDGPAARVSSIEVGMVIIGQVMCIMILSQRGCFLAKQSIRQEMVIDITVEQ